MNFQEQAYPSELLKDAVDVFTRLPGLGRRTALRMALHLLKQPQEDVERFGNAFIRLRKEIKYCRCCGMLSDNDTCYICADHRRDSRIVCVVESVRDVMSIEQTGQYRGRYHVLGGIISPIDGIGPLELNIPSLLERLEKEELTEVFFALNTSMEGETTALYLARKMAAYPVKISAIARGIGFGDDLECTDELTLGRAIQNRQPFQS